MEKVLSDIPGMFALLGQHPGPWQLLPGSFGGPAAGSTKLLEKDPRPYPQTLTCHLSWTQMPVMLGWRWR